MGIGKVTNRSTQAAGSPGASEVKHANEVKAASASPQAAKALPAVKSDQFGAAHGPATDSGSSPGLQVPEQLKRRSRRESVDASPAAGAGKGLAVDSSTFASKTMATPQSERLDAGATAGEILSRNTDWIGNLDEEKVGKEVAEKVKANPEGNADLVNKTMDQLSSRDRDDVAQAICQNMSDDDMKKLASTPDGRKALERMKSELADGWTTGGEKGEMNRIDKAIQAAEAEKVKPTPEDSGGTGGLKKLAENIPASPKGKILDYFQTGGNITGSVDGSLETALKQDDPKVKADQQRIRDDMKAKLGREVSNPPSLADTKAYFQEIANKEGAKGVKEKWAQHLASFYTHAGTGGVKWGAGSDLSNQLEKSFGDQPKTKDGRTVIDCEGYSALTENVLGGLKDKRTRPEQPMFSIAHNSSAANSHIITGVVPNNPKDACEPFIVSNHEITDVAAAEVDRKKTLLKPGDRNNRQAIIRAVMLGQQNDGNAEVKTRMHEYGKKQTPADLIEELKKTGWWCGD